MLQFPPKSKLTCEAGKNLLAFSGGVDSSGLFFTLLELGLKFGVASVNYQTREQSNDEHLHVKSLCKAHDIACHTLTCSLSDNNFEASARKARYDFFASTCSEFGYTNLLTAHQLDDRLEWFLMQLSKGAGLVELLGFEEVESRENFTLVRPFINTTKDEILEYLDKNSLPYFVDGSNFDEKYLRNSFRHNFSTPLLKKYKQGIKKSFEFLDEDKKEFTCRVLFEEQNLFIGENNAHSMRFIDKCCKRLGVVLTGTQREQILQKDGVVSGKVAIGWSEKAVFIAPHVKCVMSKEFKELCRLGKIPPLVRGHISQAGISLDRLSHTL